MIREQRNPPRSWRNQESIWYLHEINIYNKKHFCAILKSRIAFVIPDLIILKGFCFWAETFFLPFFLIFIFLGHIFAFRFRDNNCCSGFVADNATQSRTDRFHTHKFQSISASFPVVSWLLSAGFYKLFPPFGLLPTCSSRGFNILYENFYQFAFRAIECEINYIANLLWLIYILAFFSSLLSLLLTFIAVLGTVEVSVFVFFPPPKCVCTQDLAPARARELSHIPLHEYENSSSLIHARKPISPATSSQQKRNIKTVFMDLQLEFDLTSSENDQRAEAQQFK